MKRLLDKRLNASAARSQHRKYGKLIEKNPILREAEDVLPFFSASHDLCLLFSHYIPAIKEANRIATEFQIYGDFRADLVVGDATEGKYLLVEFEDGSPTSVFRKGRKAARPGRLASRRHFPSSSIGFGNWTTCDRQPISCTSLAGAMSNSQA